MIIEDWSGENIAGVLRAGVYAEWTSVEERVQLREAGYLSLSQGGSFYNITRKGRYLLAKYYPEALDQLAKNTADAVGKN